MGAGDQKWTAEELDSWFTEEVGGVDGLGDLYSVHTSSKGRPHGEGVHLEQHPLPAERSSRTDPDPDLEHFRQAWNFQKEDRMGAQDTWDALSLDAKSALRRGWERRNGRSAGEDAADGPEPVDSIVPELASDLLRADPATQPPQVDRQSDAPAPPRRPSPLAVLGITITVVILIVIILAFLLAEDADTPEIDRADLDTPTLDDDEPADDTVDESDLPIEFLVDGGVASYRGPTDLPAGQTARLVVVLTDDDGNPIVGRQVSITIGDPPSSPDAVHADAITDDEGRVVFDVGIPAQPGPSRLFFFDGAEVREVTAVEVI